MCVVFVCLFVVLVGLVLVVFFFPKRVLNQTLKTTVKIFQVCRLSAHLSIF